MKIKELTGFFERLQGLAFKNKINPVYFETRWGIHTFFVKKSIDVIILDDNFTVRKIVRNLRPWKILVWNPKYKKVLEAPVGLKNLVALDIGDKLPL